MLIRYLKKRKLVALIDRLAMYNDKGIHWSGDAPEDADHVRELLLSKISVQLAKLPNTHQTDRLKEALESGKLTTDGTGIYTDVARSIGT